MTKRIHIHIAGARKITLDRRGRFIDEFDPVDDLVKRLRAILAEQEHVTQDEDMGHKFHGNQYVEVAGQQIEVPQKGGVKSKTHELLSKGHKFSFEELLSVLGNPPKKSLTDALATLKNPKWAGPKGALDIVKGPDGKFSVAPKNAPEADPFDNFKLGDPTPLEQAKNLVLAQELEAKNAGDPLTDPLADPEWTEAAAMHNASAEAAWAEAQAKINAEVGLDDPEPEWEPGMDDPLGIAPFELPPEPPIKKGQFTSMGPNGEPISKADADVHYHAAVDSALSELTAKAKASPASESKHIALEFKQAKADGMAQWLANTKGITAEAKPQEVFKADEQLVTDLAYGIDKTAALSAWKANTSLEKQGNFPPTAKKAAPAVEPTPAHPASTDVVHPGAFGVVHDYVSADHTPISADDFVGATPKFQKGLSQFKNKLEDGHPDPVQNKKGVQAALESKLKDSKAWQTLRDVYAKKNPNAWDGSLEAHMVDTWASTSGDTHPVAIAAQIAVRKAFGMKQEHLSAGNMSNMHSNESHDDQVLSQAASSMGLPYATDTDKQNFQTGLQDFVLAQYHNTQDHFAQLGIKEVYLARGMTVSHWSSTPDVGHLKLQPVSSFSANYNTGVNFAKGGSMYLVKVPVSQIFSSYVTGYGCSNEHEVTVLAHPELIAVKGSANQMGGIQSAMAHAQKHLAPGYSAAPKTPEAVKSFATQKMSPLPKPGAGLHKIKALTAYAAAANGDINQLEELKSQSEMAGAPKTASYIQGLIAVTQNNKYITEAKQAAGKKVVSKLKITNIPAPVAGVSYKFSKDALTAAHKGDVATLKKLHDSAGGYVNTQAYINTVTKHVETQLEEQAAAAASAPATKAVKQPSTKQSLSPVVGDIPAPTAAHVAHSHYDSDEYMSWQKAGYNEQQIGKKLAMKKFLAKAKEKKA